MYHYRNLAFLLGLVLYILLFAGYINYSYQKDKKSILQEIDKELYNAAINLPLLLPENFHHKDMQPSDYSKEENLKLIKRLSKFVQTTRLEYIYALVIRDKKYHVSAASATQAELKEKKGISFYLDLYEENDEIFNTVLKENKVIYNTLKDSWGEFRAIAIPLIAEDGTRYIVGADIRLDFVDTTFHDAFYDLMLFLLPIVLLMFIYLLVGIYFHLRLEKIIYYRTKEIQEFNLMDTLTSLPNRKSLVKTLAENSKVHLAIVNTDGFQVVNDLYGNVIGDKLIIEMARSLGLFIEHSGLKLFKLHADEFAILAQKDMRQFDFLLLLERIVAQLHEKIFVIEDNSMSVLVSVGAASMVEVPLINANVALKEARKRNKRIYLYESHLDIAAEIAHNQKVIAEIHQAIEDDKIYPHFQPIYDVALGKIVKYESLMRMEKIDGTIESPYYFLDIAHQSKLYNTLSIVMLEKVLDNAKEHPDMLFSFNLSAIDIEDTSIAEKILRILKYSHVAHQLTLEILETDGFRSYKTLAVFIAEVKSYGVDIAIDDFGSGYSNFAEIVELDVDYLKIDGSLVKNIMHDTHYEHIVIAIIKFAHSLELKAIAEFVEDEALAEKLMLMGIDMLQGYHIGRPQACCTKE